MAAPRRSAKGPSAAHMYTDMPLAALPLISSILLIMGLYRWHRAQFNELRNFIDNAIEKTSHVLKKKRTVASPGATTFPKFGQLPPELRVAIWEHAMPDARTVVVKSPYTPRREAKRPAKARSLEEALMAEKPTSTSKRSRDQEDETWYSNAQIPALLHVNAEARHEALKCYQLCLGVGSAHPRIYVDFSRDTLFFGHEELMPECSALWGETKDLRKVRRLAVVPEGAWRVLRYGKVDLDGIERFTFVHETEDMSFRLGPNPKLVEDAPDEVLEALQQDEQDRRSQSESESVQDGETVQLDVQSRSDTLATIESPTNALIGPMKKRMEAAREELDTLMKVLPTQWEKEPIVSTAVFKKTRGDFWV